MTGKMWYSLHNHMHEMVDTRIARNDIGDVCVCMSGNKMHLHMAMTYEDSGSYIEPITYGQNMTRDNQSFHAEHNAIQKLPNRYNRKLLPINIFVLKTTLTGIIGNSKPCAHCLAIMSSLPNKKGYRISNVLYTNSEGNIEKKKISELMNEELHYSRLYADTKYKLRRS
jgi:cytidine deaminase